MIELKTDCKDCIHNKICKYKDNAKQYMEELKNMTYNTKHNFNWDTMAAYDHVDITFSCPHFKNGKEIMFK